jgi:hypothetical protein
MAIWQIIGVPGNPQGFGNTPGAVAKPYALDTAAYRESPRARNVSDVSFPGPVRLRYA